MSFHHNLLSDTTFLACGVFRKTDSFDYALRANIVNSREATPIPNQTTLAKSILLRKDAGKGNANSVANSVLK